MPETKEPILVSSVSPLVPSSADIFAHELPAVARLLRAARSLLLTSGYQAFTMDALAHELGVSKKTLYVHFPGKDAILERVFDAIGHRVRTDMEAVLGRKELPFTSRIAGVVEVGSRTLGAIQPALLRELQRFAPGVYQKIEDMRARTIPVVFGQLLRDGISEGKVRADLDPTFATEFWLHAIRGLVQPSTLERTQLTLPQTLQRALDLFFAGVLTPAGRKDYEKSRT